MLASLVSLETVERVGLVLVTGLISALEVGEVLGRLAAGLAEVELGVVELVGVGLALSEMLTVVVTKRPSLTGWTPLAPSAVLTRVQLNVQVEYRLIIVAGASRELIALASERYSASTVSS